MAQTTQSREGSSVIGTETEFEVAAIGNRGRYLEKPEQVTSILRRARFEAKSALDVALFEAVRDGKPNYWHEQGRHALANGSCVMLDRPSGRFEYSSSESSTARMAVIAHEAGRRIVQRAATKAFAGQAIGVFDNNVNHLAGYSFGSHENYWLHRPVAERLLNSQVLPLFLIVRQLWAGAGAAQGDGTFRISQRSHFIKKTLGEDCKLERPLVCSRDEALAEKHLGFRLHVIAGDSNVLRSAQYLKYLSTELFLRAAERGEFKDLEMILHYDRAQAVADLRAVSESQGNWKLTGFKGGARPALEIANLLFGCIRNALWQDLSQEESAGMEEWGNVLKELAKLSGQQSADGISKDDLTPLAGRVDWAAKKLMLDRAWLENENSRTALERVSLCREYHAVSLPGRIEDPTVRNGSFRGWFRESEIEAATHKPDQNTRAGLRSELVDLALHFKVPADRMFVGWSTYGVNTPTGWIRGDMAEPGVDYRGRQTPSAAIGALAGVVQAVKAERQDTRRVSELHYYDPKAGYIPRRSYSHWDDK